MTPCLDKTIGLPTVFIVMTFAWRILVLVAFLLLAAVSNFGGQFFGLTLFEVFVDRTRTGLLI